MARIARPGARENDGIGLPGRIRIGLRGVIHSARCIVRGSGRRRGSLHRLVPAMRESRCRGADEGREHDQQRDEEIATSHLDANVYDDK